MPPTLIAVTREVLRLAVYQHIELSFREAIILAMPKTIDRTYDSIIGGMVTIQPDFVAEETHTECLDEFSIVGKRHGDICWFIRQ